MAPPVEPPKEPKPLDKKYLILHIVSLPLTIACFICGVLGLFVLLDNESKFFLTNTLFGEYYRLFATKNPFISAILVNGGMVGTILVLVRLAEHRKAVATAPKPEATAKKTAETKKKK